MQLTVRRSSAVGMATGVGVSGMRTLAHARGVIARIIVGSAPIFRAPRTAVYIRSVCKLGSAIRSTERTADQASWSRTGASGLLEWLQQDKHAYPVPLTSLTSCIAMALSSAVDSVERPERERAEHRTCQRADMGC